MSALSTFLFPFEIAYLVALLQIRSIDSSRWSALIELLLCATGNLLCMSLDNFKLKLPLRRISCTGSVAFGNLKAADYLSTIHYTSEVRRTLRSSAFPAGLWWTLRICSASLGSLWIIRRTTTFFCSIIPSLLCLRAGLASKRMPKYRGALMKAWFMNSTSAETFSAAPYPFLHCGSNALVVCDISLDWTNDDADRAVHESTIWKIGSSFFLFFRCKHDVDLNVFVKPRETWLTNTLRAWRGFLLCLRVLRLSKAEFKASFQIAFRVPPFWHMRITSSSWKWVSPCIFARNPRRDFSISKTPTKFLITISHCCRSPESGKLLLLGWRFGRNNKICPYSFLIKFSQLFVVRCEN